MKKVQKTVYVDTVGRITEVLDETDPKAGNDVYLTIDIELQKKIYNAIEDEHCIYNFIKPYKRYYKVYV